MAFHAKLSPSAAHRWMNCPGSVRLIGDSSSTTTQAAMRGTAAHFILETMIIADEHDVSKYAGYTVLVKADGDEDCEMYAPDEPALDPEKPRPGWFLFIVDEEMVNGVQVTIDKVDELRDSMWNVKVYPERFIDMTWLDPRFGGTADVTLVEGEGDEDFLDVGEFEGWVHLVDHKNGYMLVDHKDNEQLLNYAVGLLHEHPKAKGVRVTISQPNAQHVEGPTRTAEYTRAEIEDFAKKMKAAALATDKPNAPLRAGDWCTFCAAKSRCSEVAETIKREAIAEFADDDIDFADAPPARLSVPNKVEELAAKAKWVPLINSWCNEVMTALQREMENGAEAPGWKLVRGRANRKWTDSYTPGAIAQRLEEFGLPLSQMFTAPELKSPAQIEKLGPKGRGKIVQFQKVKFAELMNELQYKPEGKITVVEDTDPRESVSGFANAAEEFNDDEDFGV